MRSPNLPTELSVNTTDKSVRLDPTLAEALPGIGSAFEQVDASFQVDKERYLSKLQDSIFTFESNGSTIACSLLHGAQPKSDEALVIFAPFSDDQPWTSAEVMSSYLRGEATKNQAAPNSWNQTTKSAVISDLLQALGHDIPVLTVYSPVPLSAYSSDERRSMKQGDFASAGRLATQALDTARLIMHGDSGTSRFNKLHFAGASLGAANAIGAADSIAREGQNVRTVTAQELILGPRSIPELIDRFMVHKLSGADPSKDATVSNERIAEPQIRREIDRNGSETVGMLSRMARGMAQELLTGRLTKPEKTVEAITHLLNRNVEVLVALAHNSAMSKDTKRFLPHAGEHVIDLVGENGQRLGHIANEYVALSALVLALNVARQKTTPSV